MTYKEIAKTFLNLAAKGQVQEAYDRLVAPHFIHHNQHFRGDRQSLLNAMQEAHQQSPNKSIEIKQIFEDGNSVVTHSLVLRQNPAEPSIAVVHIFRFEGQAIVELWDLGQPLTADSPNKNGPF